jgi:hypothetical protein
MHDGRVEAIGTFDYFRKNVSDFDNHVKLMGKSG